MRITYPKAIQESEEDLKQWEQQLRAPDGLQPGPGNAMVGTLSGTRAGTLAGVLQTDGAAVATDSPGVGRLAGADARRPHRDDARCPRLLGAGVGHQLQERQVAVVALQETSGQVEDRAPTTQESQCRAAGRL